MVGKLNPEEIENLLKNGMIAHLGCHAAGRTYVVPITYAYANDTVYGHTAEGLKLAMLRDNPEVCVQIEQIDGPMQWRSVIAWGTFEQVVQADEIAKALQLLLDRYYAPDRSQLARGPLGPHRRGRVRPDAQVYRIRLTEKSGRFESESALDAA